MHQHKSGTSASTSVFYDNFRFQEDTSDRWPATSAAAANATHPNNIELPRRLKIRTVYGAAVAPPVDIESRTRHGAGAIKSAGGGGVGGGGGGGRRRGPAAKALDRAAAHGLQAMMELYEVREPGLLRKGRILDRHHPGAILSHFSAPTDDDERSAAQAKAAYAALETLKQLKKRFPGDFAPNARHAPPRISLRRTPLEGLCPPRSAPHCPATSRRYRTFDGTCNNGRKPRWGAAQSPFHRFLAPAYDDGVELVRRSVVGEAALASARFVSLLVHGTRDEDAGVTLMLAQWGQFVDHDVTATAQPRSINGSIPSCCDASPDDFQHPACLPIAVPADDPWLAPLGLHCLEFLRSAPALRADCALSWREQTNQVTSYLDASTIYSSAHRSADAVRTFRDGRLHFGRGNAGGAPDVCQRHAMSGQCIRSGDGRSGEQPGLLAMHHVWVAEHNRLAEQLGRMNGHWSDEKLFQEARRLVGAMVQHITYREFVPVVVGREVCRLFDLELAPDGRYYGGYDAKVNPTVANAFSSAAFRFGHSLIQGSYMRCAANHQFIFNNVSLHNENAAGDIGSAGSLHRLLRGLAVQRSQKRDEFITAELTNHLFQSGSFPFGLDLAAINIQRGRDHGLPAYTQWREPCGLTPIRDWADLERVVGAESARRMEQGYASVDDIDLFVAGLSERPVIGGLVGPTFACIIAQQFSNLRKGDRFWYENGGTESAFTPAQLQSLRQVSLSQVLCRTLGGGTLQPHVFLPHDTDGNERRPCGDGLLAPIDLLPWQERDPQLVRRKDEAFGDQLAPPLPLHNKQESLDLPAESDQRPNRAPLAGGHSGPQPGSFIVELEPGSLSRPLRPNREPVRPTASGSTVALRPQELPPRLRPSASTQIRPDQSSTTFTASGHRPFTAATVDKVDFIANGATGVVQPTHDDHPQRPLTDRPIDNKLDFDRPTKQKPNRRPTFHLATLMRTATATTTTELNENELDNTIASGPSRRKRDTQTADETDAHRAQTDSQPITNSIQPSVRFGFHQAIRYPIARPQPTRVKQPNVIIIQGTSDADTEAAEYPQYPDKYGLYRPSYTSTSTHRPSLSTDRYEYGPDGDYVTSYDRVVVTTEKFSVYKPLGNRDRDRDQDRDRDYFEPQYVQYAPVQQQQYQQQQLHQTHGPPHQFRPEKVHLGALSASPPSSTARPPYVPTPFSWDTRRSAAGAQDRHDRGWSDTAQPTKLDFDDDDINDGTVQSPFSGNPETATTRPHRRPGTIYVMHDTDDDDNDDDDQHTDYHNQRPTRQSTTPRQSDKLQAMITWRPSTTTDLPTETTTKPYAGFSPAAVLTNFVSSITRFFGGNGKMGQTRRGNGMDSDMDTVDGGLRRPDNWTDIDRPTGTDALPVLTNLTEHTGQTELRRDIDDLTNRTLQYDLDGYLRPEYMHRIGVIRANVSTDQDQDRDTLTYRQATTDDNDDDNDRPTNSVRPKTVRPLDWHELETRARQPSIISIVPFEVLTRPERPDNWVFVDAVQTVDALPAPPPLAVSENAVREMPRPLRPFGG